MQSCDFTRKGARAPIVPDWTRLWSLWDSATLVMIRADDVTVKPLQLRHPFIFYIGHLPAFTDARLARVLQEQLSEPAEFADIFARGIDPDLEDPAKCHNHSPVPDAWPDLSAILEYRDRVRSRVRGLYQSSSSTGAGGPQATAAVKPNGVTSLQDPQLLTVAQMPLEVQHVLWMCYEHEAMHLETLMYMLVQYEHVRPPPKNLLPRSTVSNGYVLSAAAAGMDSKQQLDGETVDAEQAESFLSKDSRLSHRGAASPLLPLPAAATWVYLPGQRVMKGFDPVPSGQQVAPAAAAASADGIGSGSGDGTYVSKPGRQTAAANSASLEVTSKVTLSTSASTSYCIHTFGWDNESPARCEEVASCLMQHRAVSVIEYLWFITHEVNKHLLQQQQQRLHDNATGHYDHCNGCPDESDAAKISTKIQQNDDISTSSTSSSSSTDLLSSAVHELLSAGGALQHLVPLSLSLLSPEAASSAAAAAVQRDGSIALRNCDLQTSSCLLGILQCMIAVKTVFGQVSVTTAGYWPVYCSARQAELYAEWWDTVHNKHSSSSSSSRLPSEGELLLAQEYNRAAGQAAAAAASGGDSISKGLHSQQVTAVPGQNPCRGSSTRFGVGAVSCGDHQQRDGGSASGCALGSEKLGLAANKSCTSSAVAAVDFNTWHPVDVQLQPTYTSTLAKPTTAIAAAESFVYDNDCSNIIQQQQHKQCCSLPLLSQLLENGWEWSSSVLDMHPGFKPHHLYPEYSADFFDSKHQVLLGASWATVSSIAERTTFRNFYQAGQQHVFAKFRLCKSACNSDWEPA